MSTWRMRLAIGLIIIGLLLLALSHIAEAPGTKQRSNDSTDSGFYRALSLRPIPTIPPKAPEMMHTARDCMNAAKPIKDGLKI